MDGLADEKRLHGLIDALKNTKVKALSLNQESLAEALLHPEMVEPLSQGPRYTERPDTAAACLLEGDILVLVDNSPFRYDSPHQLFCLYPGRQRFLLSPHHRDLSSVDPNLSIFLHLSSDPDLAFVFEQSPMGPPLPFLLSSSRNRERYPFSGNSLASSFSSTDSN